MLSKIFFYRFQAQVLVSLSVALANFSAWSIQGRNQGINVTGFPFGGFEENPFPSSFRLVTEFSFSWL